MRSLHNNALSLNAPTDHAKNIDITAIKRQLIYVNEQLSSIGFEKIQLRGLLILNMELKIILNMMAYHKYHNLDFVMILTCTGTCQIYYYVMQA